MAGLSYLDPTAVNRGVDAWDEFGNKLEDAVVKRHLMRSQPGEEPVSGPDPYAAPIQQREMAPAPPAVAAIPTESTAPITPVQRQDLPPPKAGLTTSTASPMPGTWRQGQLYDERNPVPSPDMTQFQTGRANNAATSNFDMELAKVRGGASDASSLIGQTAGRVKDYFTKTPGQGAVADADRAETTAMSDWYHSQEALDLFKANPMLLREAQQDLLGFYRRAAPWWRGQQGADVKMPAAASIGKPGETPPDDHMAALAYAVALEESGNDPTQKSKTSTAKGAMQVLDGTAAKPGFGVKPAQDGSMTERDRVGQDYLKKMVTRYDNIGLALMAYNQGPDVADKVQLGKPLSVAEQAKVEAGNQYASRVLARLSDHETNGVGELPRAGLTPIPAVVGAPLAMAPIPAATGTPAPTNLAAVSNNRGQTVPAGDLQIPVAQAAPAAAQAVTPAPDTTRVSFAQASPTNLEVRQQMIERNRLKELAGAYRSAGAGDRYFATLRQMDAVDKQLTGFATNRALDNFESGGRPEYLSQVLSQASGQQVVLRPRSDGKFDEEINGQRAAEGLSRADLVNRYRYRASSVYAAGVRTAQIGAQTKANDEEYKRKAALEMEILKGRVQLTLEEVKGMGKVTPGRDGGPTTVQLRNGQVAVINPVTAKGVDGVDRTTFTLAPLGGSGGYSPSDYKVGP